MSALSKIITELRGATSDLAHSNNAHFEKVGYFRICNRNERVADLLSEARKHGSVLAFKGAASCIMPAIAEGWTRYGGIVKGGVK